MWIIGRLEEENAAESSTAEAEQRPVGQKRRRQEAEWGVEEGAMRSVGELARKARLAKKGEKHQNPALPPPSSLPDFRRLDLFASPAPQTSRPTSWDQQFSP